MAFGIGALFTLITATLSFYAMQAGAELISEILFWPNALLQSLMPAPNLGTPEHAIHEGTPLNFLAFLVSFILAVWVYSAIAYLFLRRRGKIRDSN